MRRSGAGGGRDGAEANAARVVAGDEGVKVAPVGDPGTSGLVLAIWSVTREGRELLRFDGDGAQARAEDYARGVREEIRRGTFSLVRARGKCCFGSPCDRDRLNVAFLRDASDAMLERVSLCVAHRAQARPGDGLGEASKGPVAGSPAPEAPPGGTPAGSPVAGGRRRKAARS